MQRDDRHDPVNPTKQPDASRREFLALAVSVGLGAASGSATGAATGAPVVARDVEVRTPDGICDAAFFHPATGAHPGVLIWTDVFGLRPVFREFGRRLAAEGYGVLVPNPFYRTAKAPVLGDISAFDFENAADRAKLQQFTTPLSAPGAAQSDAKAYVAFLDAQAQVNTAKKIGTQGYCMGGPLVVKTAAAVADRIGAGASFHGGGLVTDKPDSPHLLAPRIKAHMYFAVAAGDDQRQPEAKTTLGDAFAAAGNPAQIEVYANTQHGWCVPDMPAQSGQPIYDPADAARAWTKLLSFYAAVLA
jgi:carboxymethylenebutenolidase